MMSTHDGYYKQVEGLAMGSPPAPHLANGWLSQFDGTIQGNSKVYFRYMDDILKEEKIVKVETILCDVNTLHPNLTFTLERARKQEQHPKKWDLPVLDMKIIHDRDTGSLSSTWYSKPTDTGLIMNFHALAPKRYKRSVVSGFVYRIFRACSTWQLFHESLEKAKRVLERNQYPPTFYESIIRETLDTILRQSQNTPESESIPSPAAETPPTQPSKSGKFKLRVQYRGKATEDYARALHKCDAPCMIVMTLRKLKTVMPSLKPPVEKMLRSGLVYQLTCPSCDARYVGETCRHMLTRFKEHTQKAGPMKKHLQQCGATLTEDQVDILQMSSRGEDFLLTLEALHIRERKPQINTKDEYRSRELTIKL